MCVSNNHEQLDWPTSDRPSIFCSKSPRLFWKRLSTNDTLTSFLLVQSLYHHRPSCNYLAHHFIDFFPTIKRNDLLDLRYSSNPYIPSNSCFLRNISPHSAATNKAFQRHTLSPSCSLCSANFWEAQTSSPTIEALPIDHYLVVHKPKLHVDLVGHPQKPRSRSQACASALLFRNTLLPFFLTRDRKLFKDNIIVIVLLTTLPRDRHLLQRWSGHKTRTRTITKVITYCTLHNHSQYGRQFPASYGKPNDAAATETTTTAAATTTATTTTTSSKWRWSSRGCCEYDCCSYTKSTTTESSRMATTSHDEWANGNCFEHVSRSLPPKISTCVTKTKHWQSESKQSRQYPSCEFLPTTTSYPPQNDRACNPIWTWHIWKVCRQGRLQLSCAATNSNQNW